MYIGPDEEYQTMKKRTRDAVQSIYIDMSATKPNKNQRNQRTQHLLDTPAHNDVSSNNDDVMYFNLGSMKRKDTFPGDIALPESFLKNHTQEMSF